MLKGIKKLKLCMIPLCLTKNCNGAKMPLLPTLEKPESISGRTEEIRTHKTKTNFEATNGKKNIAAKIPITR